MCLTDRCSTHYLSFVVYAFISSLLSFSSIVVLIVVNRENIHPLHWMNWRAQEWHLMRTWGMPCSFWVKRTMGPTWRLFLLVSSFSFSSFPSSPSSPSLSFSFSLLSFPFYSYKRSFFIIPLSSHRSKPTQPHHPTNNNKIITNNNNINKINKKR